MDSAYSSKVKLDEYGRPIEEIVCDRVLGGLCFGRSYCPSPPYHSHSEFSCSLQKAMSENRLIYPPQYEIPKHLKEKLLIVPSARN